MGECRGSQKWIRGLSLDPALLNLHDEDLDKREFLKQATAKFPARQNAPVYPFTQLQEARKTLNERVKFGRATAHPSLQVAKREALAGMIQLGFPIWFVTHERRGWFS